jgi:hypothetical protein
MVEKLMKSLRSPTRLPKAAIRVAAILAGFLLILFIASFFIDGPLRRTIEEGVNRALDGYTVELAEADFHPIGFSVTLRDLSIVQDAHPEPPVAVFPEIDVSVHWRELLSGRLVGEWQLEQPQLYINLLQLREENKDEVPVEKRGWLEAIQAVYPLKINLFQIIDGTFIYIDEDPERPLELRHIQFEADNIRNIHSSEGTYPSSFHLTTDIFGKGRAEIEGRADFLADPHPGVNARFSIEKVPLENFKPVTSRANLIVAGGVLTGSGSIEYAPSVKSTHIEKLEIDGIRIDYVHSAATARQEEKRIDKAKEVAGESIDKPGVLLLIEHLRLTGEAGMLNQASNPNYRVFLSDASLELTNLSNQFREGPANARLTGKFMGSGETTASATFRPEKGGADFDLDLKIENTRLPEMNNLLRAYGNFDVVAGTFSVYAEIAVQGKRIEGYIKPLFEGVNVYSPAQEKGEGLFQKIYERLVGGISVLLKNVPREEVATRIDISGTVDDPDISSWEIIRLLIRNAFFEAIFPGFEFEAKKSVKKG